MKRTTRILTIVLLILSVISGSCNHRAVSPLVVSSHDTTAIEVNNNHFIQDTPGIPDSASIHAFLKCDSLGRIYIETISQLQGKIVQQALQMEDNTLQVDAVAETRERKETTSRDSIITVIKEKPVPYPVEKITNQLTSWQSFQIWCGRILLGLLLIYIVVKFAAGKLSFITKLFK